MSSQTKVADEYAFIAARLAEIEKEKLEAINAEMPKAWPMHSANESADDIYSMYYPC